jgi:hypothetical protein
LGCGRRDWCVVIWTAIRFVNGREWGTYLGHLGGTGVVVEVVLGETLDGVLTTVLDGG